MDKIFITDLLIRGVIGITEKEREQPQDILINIKINTDISIAAKNDDVDESVNYRTVAKKILAHVESIKRYTVEALAEDIAKLCLDEPHAQSVVVKVEKPGAVRFSKSVGVEIERTK
jgi:FolB domain-containing protein